jgi:hypothetical protein
MFYLVGLSNRPRASYYTSKDDLMKYYVGPWVQDSMGVWTGPAGTISILDLRSNTEQNQASYGFFAVPDNITLNSDYRQFGGAGYVTELVPVEADRSVFSSMLGVPSVNGTTLMDWIWDIFTIRSDPLGLTSVKPIVPTMAGDLDIHLAEHSLVRRKKFDLTMPEAAPVIALLKEQYKQYRIDAKAGKLNADPEFHRRILDFWGEKYKVNNPEDIFIPAGVPKETRLPHKTTISDDFTRADSTTMGTSSEGWSWVECGNARFRITSNQVTHSSAITVFPDGFAEANSALSTDDHQADVDVVTMTVSSTNLGTLGSVVRLNQSIGSVIDNYYGRLGKTDSAANPLVTLDKTVGGTASNIGVGTFVVLSLPDTIRTKADGSTISTYFNGVQVHSVTDTSTTGVLKTGAFLYATNQTTVTLVLDNFTATDVAASALKLSMWAYGKFSRPLKRRIKGNV